MKQSSAYLVIYLIFLVGLNVLIFNVSMGEPYTTPTMNELIWQLVIPSILIGSKIILLPLIVFMSAVFGTKTKYFAVTIMLFFLLLEFATVYGYLHELKIE